MYPKFNPTPQRSAVMSSIRKTDTKAEVLLRKQLWRTGVRGYRKYSTLPGTPDLLFPKKKLVVFVDGCFWHKCPDHFRPPKSNEDYWLRKIKGNVDRDKHVDEKLESSGYAVLRIWEHEIFSDVETAALRIKEVLDSL